MPAQILWRRVLQATIDTLRGLSRGQYDIRLARPAGIDEFFAGLPRVDTDLGGYNVQVPLAATTAPVAVPATSITVAYIGPESARNDWRIPSQRPDTAYPLWRLGLGLQEETEAGTDFIVIVRDARDTFHARWVPGDQMERLPSGVAQRMRASDSGVAEIEDVDWESIQAALDLPQIGEIEPATPPLHRVVPPGETYRVEDESISTPRPEPFVVDPDVIDRGISGHRRTQNLLAKQLEEAGIDPLSHRVGVDPSFDLGWRIEGVLYVAEVKSLTPQNEERQLRLGLGQILRYAFQLRASEAEVVPVLVCESEPSDPTWPELCEDLGVALIWPATFEVFIRE